METQNVVPDVPKYTNQNFSQAPAEVKKTHWLAYVAIIALIIAVIVVIYFLLQTPQAPATNSNTNTNTNSNNSTNTNNTTNTDSSTTALADTRTTFSSTKKKVSAKEYYSFDSCNAAKTDCTHYLLLSTELTANPIISTLANTMPALVSGKVTKASELNTTGHQYFYLTKDILINVIAKYVAKEADTDNATKMNYVFSTCATVAPPCAKYLVSESYISSIPFVASLVKDSEVAISGEVKTLDAAAGTQYYKMATIFIAKL